MSKEGEIQIPVPAKDPVKKEDLEPKHKKFPKKDEKEELSDDDKLKKEQLDTLVQSVKDNDGGVQKLALEQMRSEIRSATSSMTSVPKPLKFLRPHFQTLKDRFDTTVGENKALLSDILSVLAMTMSKPGLRESLKFKLTGTKEALTSWGHEYVRNLTGEIASEYDHRHQENDTPNVDDLIALIDEIVPYDMKHNAEPEACDLLMEVEMLEKVLPHIDETNYSRVCLYLTSCANYVPEPDDAVILKVTYEAFKKMKNKTLEIS